MSNYLVDISNLRVVNSTDWIELGGFRNLEQGSGVFVFSNFLYQVKYIGKARNKEMIESIDEAIRNGKSVGISKLKVYYTKNEYHAMMLQKKLMMRYKSALT